MREPATGEPCAGKPHARFGGRGGLTSFPTPIDVEATVAPCGALISRRILSLSFRNSGGEAESLEDSI